MAPFVVECLEGRTNRRLPRLPLHMHADQISPGILMSNIHIGRSVPKAFTLSHLQSYEMLEVLVIVRIYKSVGHRGILKVHLLRDTVPYCISKKHFRPGGMALTEWMRSVRAVRDTPVADYTAPGINTTRRVAYRSPIAVSPFLLALSVYYFTQTLWRSGQL